MAVRLISKLNQDEIKQWKKDAVHNYDELKEEDKERVSQYSIHLHEQLVADKTIETALLTLMSVSKDSKATSKQQEA